MLCYSVEFGRFRLIAVGYVGPKSLVDLWLRSLGWHVADSV